MRHAKSSWKSDAPDDHARPLNKRGQRDAELVAEELQTIGWLPEQVYSSDSERTRQTLELMLKRFRPTPNIEYLPTLYHGGVQEIREAAAGASAEVATVMVLGHNPGWQHAVYWLSGEHVPMTTANAALLESEGENWCDVLIGEQSWEFVEVIRPKEILAAENED